MIVYDRLAPSTAFTSGTNCLIRTKKAERDKNISNINTTRDQNTPGTSVDSIQFRPSDDSLFTLAP